MAQETTIAGLAEFLAAHADLLESLHSQAGADRWHVSQHDFAASLYRSAAHRFSGAFPAAETLAQYLQSLQLHDLALVCALQRGAEPAWNEFVAQYRPLLHAAARAIVGAAGEAHARDLADSVEAIFTRHDVNLSVLRRLRRGSTSPILSAFACVRQPLSDRQSVTGDSRRSALSPVAHRAQRTRAAVRSA